MRGMAASGGGATNRGGFSVSLRLRVSPRWIVCLTGKGTPPASTGTPSHVTHTSGSPARRSLTVTVPGIIGSLLVLVVAAVCVRLGVWQLDRLEQRRTRNAQVEARLAEPPLTVDAILRDTVGVLFRRARVRGRPDPDRSIALAGRSHRGAPGVHLLTPLQLVDGSAVLVNRGWVPSADGASIDFAAVADTSVIDEEGIVLPLPGAGAPRAESSGNGGFQRVWFRIDAAALARQYPYPLATYQIQLLGNAGQVGGPRRLDPPELDAGPHLGYALQWFSFATIAIIGWIALILRRTPTRSRKPTDSRFSAEP